MTDAEIALIVQEARYGTDCPVSGDFDAAVRDAILAGYRAGQRESANAISEGSRARGRLAHEVEQWRAFAQTLTGVDANDCGWLRAEMESQWRKRDDYAVKTAETFQRIAELCAVSGHGPAEERLRKIAEAMDTLERQAGRDITKTENEIRHVCGLAGYNGMIDPPCPGCEANRSHAIGTTQPYLGQLALQAIRARDAESGATWFTGPASFTAQSARDRRALLGEVDRLILLVRQKEGERIMAENPDQYPVLSQGIVQTDDVRDVLKLAVRYIEMEMAPGEAKRQWLDRADRILAQGKV